MDHRTHEDAIRRLLAEYCQLADDGDLDAWVDLFATDATLALPGRPAAGRDEMSAGARSTARSETPAQKHVTLNPIIDVAGEDATARSDFMVLGPSPEGPVVLVAGRYDDRFVMEDGRWRFAARVASVYKGFAQPGLR